MSKILIHVQNIRRTYEVDLFSFVSLKSIILAALLIVLAAISPIIIISAEAYHNDRTSRGSDDPKIAVDGNTAYVVWKESTDPQFWDAYFAKITDGILHEPINLTKGTSFSPNVQVSVSENNVYVLWEDRKSQDGDDAVFFTKSNDSGNTFDVPRMIAPVEDGGTQTVYRPFTMETSNDNLYVFASNWNRENQQSQVVYLASSDFGQTFSEPVALFNHEQYDQNIVVEKYGETIHVMSDDRHDYDEKGSLYMRKILPDGTMTEIVDVNGGKTTVTYPQFAVSGENIYVSWRERIFADETGKLINERWYPAFAKSHDGGLSFDEPIILDTDPKSIDVVGTTGDFVFADEDYVYVLWRSEYWDGENQEFKIHLATSKNNGDSFDVASHPLNELVKQQGTVMSFHDGESLYSVALTAKNPPQNDVAAYFAKKSQDGTFDAPFDMFSGISTQSGLPEIGIDDNYVHFVADAHNDRNCILYSSSTNYGTTFNEIVNISPNGNDFECLGVLPNIPTPMQQTRNGISLQDIQCSQKVSKGYILVLRATDKRPACITADSYVTLKERGWMLEDYSEELALFTAREFVLSSPTFSFDGIKDTLNLDVLYVRKSIPAVVTITGEFETEHSGYGNRAGQELTGEGLPVPHDVKMTIVQNNVVHSAILDDSWNMITQDTGKQKPSIHRYTHSGPTVSTTLTVAEPVNSKGLVPVIVTEKSENVRDKATFWMFQITGYAADNRYKEWDTLPDDKRIGWTFFSKDGSTDVWDDAVISSDMFAIPADLHGYPMFCDGKRIDGESGHTSDIPIKPEFDTIYAQSGNKAILPDSNGVYSVEFATLFETDVKLTGNAEIIENKTILCNMENTREDATHGYYTKLVFKMDDNNLGNNYEILNPNSIDVSSKPYDGAIIGDDHVHASILVKIFGDRFDFSQADFQIKNPWIHFEGQDGSTIHRHAKHVTLGYLFDTLNIGLSPDCYTFPEGREFCSADEYSLKFYINGERIEDIRDYVISEGDKILMSYGDEGNDEIQSQLEELDMQEIRS